MLKVLFRTFLSDNEDVTAKTFFDFVTTYKPTSGMENLVLYIRKVSANFR